MNITDSINNADPVHSIYSSEFSQTLMKFCSFVSILNGKKINYANAFLCILQDKNIRKLYKAMIGVEEDYNAIRLFLEFEPSLYKSKYITKYLNSAGKNKIK